MVKALACQMGDKKLNGLSIENRKNNTAPYICTNCKRATAGFLKPATFQ